MQQSGWGGRRPGAGRPATVGPEREERQRRQLIIGALQYGPFCWNFSTRKSEEAFTDDELRTAFETWARDECDWAETTYARWRFIAGLSREDTMVAMAEARERQYDAERLETVVESNIRNPHDPYLHGLPAQYVAELLARARPLQKPSTCWACNEREALPTGGRCAECEEYKLTVPTAAAHYARIGNEA